MSCRNPGQSKEFFNPIKSQRIFVNQSQARIKTLNEVNSSLSFDYLGIDGVSVGDVAVRNIEPIVIIFDAAQQLSWLLKKKNIAIQLQHPFALKIMAEVEYPRREMISLAKLEAARKGF